MMNAILKNKKGFGMLEIAVSISVIMISVIPIVNLLSSSLKQESDIEERLTAVFLAQEGMEIIRKMRDDDNNFPLTAAPVNGDKVIVLNATTTKNDCKNSSIGNGFMLADKSTAKMQVFTKNNKGYIQCETEAAMDQSNQWHNSGFQRYVSISYPAAGIMQVIVKVERGGQELYSLTSYLNDVQ